MVPWVDIKTYTRGFHFEMHKPLTKDGLVKLCRSLETRFGDGHAFKPHAVGNGFLHWASWPGKSEERTYKCMRQWPMPGTRNQWPIVTMDAMTSWVGNQEVALQPGKYYTFLKAFYAVTAWTDDELCIVKECLEDAGFTVTRMPSLAAADKRLKRDAALWKQKTGS